MIALLLLHTLRPALLLLNTLRPALLLLHTLRPETGEIDSQSGSVKSPGSRYPATMSSRIQLIAIIPSKDYLAVATMF